LAKGKEAEVFDYGEEGWQNATGHRHNAREWFGLDDE
jgi:hypothetical protein